MTDVKRSFCIFAASTYWLKWLERRDIERLHIIWRVFVCISWLMASKPQLGKSCIKSPLWTQNNTTGINMIWKYDFLSIPFWERGTRKSFLFSLFQKWLNARSDILEPRYGRDGQGRARRYSCMTTKSRVKLHAIGNNGMVCSGSMSILASIVL